MFTGLALSLVLAASVAPPQPIERPITEYIEQSAWTIRMPSAPAVRSRGSDSLKNGAIIGAVIGGIATGTFMGLLCHALNDTDNPNCWKATLLWGGIGAAAGGGIGAGVDALFGRRTTFAASVRF